MPRKPTTPKRRTPSKPSARKSKSTKPRRGASASRGKKPRTFKVQPLTAGVVEQPPETALTRKGLSLRTLMRNTDNFRKSTGKEEVTISKLKRQKTKSGLPAISAIAEHYEDFMPNKTVQKREVYIIGLDDQSKPVSKQKRVMVSCTCEDWVYHGAEYACAVHGAARIIYGNGKPPTMTNPRNHPFLCKHLIALAQEVIDKGL